MFDYADVDVDDDDDYVYTTCVRYICQNLIKTCL